MKAYRIPIALLFLIFYASCAQEELLSERTFNDEFNNEIALVEDSRATPSTPTLTDFFQDYDFDNGSEILLENGGKLVTYSSLLNRDDQLVVIYENNLLTPNVILKQKGLEIDVFNGHLTHQFSLAANEDTSRDLISCILALAEFSECLVDMYNAAVANPASEAGQALINNPIYFWTIAAIACELRIMDVLTALNQLGCLLPIIAL